jgi:formate hydrogenlyase subunit 6/NADH:ubiquinone oxidoreductase subunit I
MCVEACPCNAILMDTQDMILCKTTPNDLVMTKKQLLDW